MIRKTSTKQEKFTSIFIISLWLLMFLITPAIIILIFLVNLFKEGSKFIKSLFGNFYYSVISFYKNGFRDIKLCVLRLRYGYFKTERIYTYYDYLESKKTHFKSRKDMTFRKYIKIDWQKHIIYKGLMKNKTAKEAFQGKK